MINKHPKFSSVLLLVICLAAIQALGTTDDAVPTGDYFGQPLPGETAIMFAPGIFSLPDRLESKIAFSPDGNEYYFGVTEIKDNSASYKIYYSKRINNTWSKQVEAPFSVNNNASSPFISADGKRLYFNRGRDIWVVNRTANGWDEAQPLPTPINSDSYDGAYAETNDNVVYFSSKRPGGSGGMDSWRLHQLPGIQQEAVNLGPIINTTAFDVSPCIAPDGSYLIFGSERNGRTGLAHLYICFNKGNNEWTAPLNMNSCGAKINNGTAHHNSTSLSPDGKFLFFVRHEDMMNMNVFWVSTTVIEKLKDKAMQEDSP